MKRFLVGIVFIIMGLPGLIYLFIADTNYTLLWMLCSGYVLGGGVVSIAAKIIWHLDEKEESTEVQDEHKAIH